MKFPKWMLVGILLSVPAVLIAVNVGTYNCPGCGFQDPVSGPDEAYILRTVANHDTNSWVDDNGKPKSATLCNGGTCADYTYIKLSGLWKKDRVYGAPGDGSGGGGPGSGGPGSGAPGDGGPGTGFDLGCTFEVHCDSWDPE